MITDAIQNAGGLKNWQPDHFNNPEDIKNKELVDLQVQYLWQWVKQEKKNNNLTQVYLGYGAEDRYAKAHKLFTNFLVKNNVTEINGKHNWNTGRNIWQQQLTKRVKTGMLKPCT